MTGQHLDIEQQFISKIIISNATSVKKMSSQNQRSKSIKNEIHILNILQAFLRYL